MDRVPIMDTTTTVVHVTSIAFLEFSSKEPDALATLFQQLGFNRIGTVRIGTVHSSIPMQSATIFSEISGPVSLFRQGMINFISNSSLGGNAEAFRAVHSTGASAIGFRVPNSLDAFQTAIALGAIAAPQQDYAFPAIRGIGQSLIYFVDADDEARLEQQFGIGNHLSLASTNDVGLVKIDHLTHNLTAGGISRICNFYERIFGFKKIRSFDIEGKKTGLYSEVIASPNGEIVIPLNESKDDRSQIAEFIREYNGEGIQHIALTSHDIYTTIDALSVKGITFQDTPNTYYDLIERRLPDHGEELDAMRNRKILIDGGESQGGGLLLQIFSKNAIGPIFF